jgi:hypothetical protein
LSISVIEDVERKIGCTRDYVLHQTPEESARQRKQNRLYVCKNFEVLSHLKKLKGNRKRAECVRDCLALKSRRRYKVKSRE